MSLRVDRLSRALVAPMIEELSTWAPKHGYIFGLHAGDVGWHLRMDDADLADTLVVIRDGGDMVACALAEPRLMRPAFRSDRLDDGSLASAMADVACELASRAQVWSDAPSESAYRAELGARGWQLDPESWSALYRPLTTADGVTGSHEADANPLRDEQDIADRVAVQLHAFARSTFTVARWHQMAAGPGFDPAFEMLRRDRAGTAVSAATGWLAGPGRVAILEPVGTHRDHTGAGHGRAVCEAVIGALARAGASGVSIATPSSNVAAVRTYVASGLKIVDRPHAMVSPPH